MSDPTSARAKTLPVEPSLEHLRNEAKRHLKTLRLESSGAKLAQAQLAVARSYGFSSWRALKAHVDGLDPDRELRERVFKAARQGDVDTVRRAFVDGFDPATLDGRGRTVHQIAKLNGRQAVELLARDFQEREERPLEMRAAHDAILAAAHEGHVDELARLLDANPGLIDLRGGNFQRQTALHKAAWANREACVRLLIARGADVNIRDHGDNASPLHFAAEAADLSVVQMLVEAGSDIVGEGDDHGLGVLGWATCFRTVRNEVADYLLGRGAPLGLWSAIALDRGDEVRRLIARDGRLLDARMSRNEHHRTPLHHAAGRNRRAMVALLLQLGADPMATDAIGATALTTAAQAGADPAILAMLERAGAALDLPAALALGRFDVAEAMLRDDPSRIGPEGGDTIALHVAASRRDIAAVRWLIEKGVDVNAMRNMFDCDHAALHVVAGSGAVDIARLLLDAGADPMIRDGKYRSTALGWAEFCGQGEVAALVRERGGT